MFEWEEVRIINQFNNMYKTVKKYIKENFIGINVNYHWDGHVSVLHRGQSVTFDRSILKHIYLKTFKKLLNSIK